MSDHPSSGSPYPRILGIFTMIFVPVAMIGLLGITGYAFINNSGIEVSESDDTAATAAPAPAAVAPTPAPSTPAPTAAVETAAAGSVAIDPAAMEVGKGAYNTCLACHGADGKGLAIGPQLMAPSLAGSEILLGDPDGPLLVVLKGILKEGNDHLGVMAPLGAMLDDEKLAAVLTYSRNSFGNSAPAVTTEQAKAAREKFAEVPMNVSRSKIEEIVAAHKSATAATPAPAAAVETAAAGAVALDPAAMEMGKGAYNTCLACHGADGKGLAIGPQLMAPSLAGSELLLGDPDGPLLVVLKGILKEGNDHLGVMAPLGAMLDDEKLAAVLTYSRNSFGNSAPAVTTEQAKGAREKFAEVPMNVSRSKIEEIVAAHK